ncbi:ATP-dependent DNA ligase [Vibrio phage K397]
MKNIYEVVTTLGDTKGMNAKKALLEGLEPALKSDVQKYVRFALDPRLSLYQTLSDDVRVKLNGMQLAGTPKRTILEALEYVSGMASLGETRGDSGKMLLSRVRSRLENDEERELFDRFVDRNWKTGIGIKSINALWPNTLAYSPYQRCEGGKTKFLDALDWANGVISQLKSDGMFLNVYHHIIDGCIPTVEFTSREGNVLDSGSLAGLRADVFEMLKDTPTAFGHYLHGEALVWDAEGNLLPREQGNGKLNSIIQTGEDLPEGYVVRFRVWDIIPETVFEKSLSKKEAIGAGYADRWEYVQDLYASAGELEHIQLQESKIVYSLEEAMAHFQECLERGEEGTIVKCPNGLWYDGTSQHMLKLKLEVDCDLVIVGINEGDPNGKHADTFGSLQCESSCGMLAVGVSGMPDSLRQEIYDNFELWKGSIVAIKSNGIQENSAGNEVISLFLPRLASERRLDKHEADSLERIREIQAATIKNGGKTPASV